MKDKVNKVLILVENLQVQYCQITLTIQVQNMSMSHCKTNDHSIWSWNKTGCDMHTKLKMASYANEQQPLIAENSFIDQGDTSKLFFKN